MKKYLLPVILLFTCHALNSTGQQASQQYPRLQKKLAKGWKTWSYDNALTRYYCPKV